jgi:hypothetical protein
MTIVTRKQLGRPLTWDELDGNFSQVDSLVTQAADAVSTAQGAVTTSANNAAQAAQSATDAAAAAQNAGSAVSRSVRAPQGETLNELPAASLRQNKVQTFNATGQPSLADITGFVQLDNTGKIPAAQLPSTIVTSVNGKQGAATLYASDIANTSSDAETVSGALSRLQTLPANTFLFPHFRSNNDVAVYFAVSSDGKVFETLNDSLLPVRQDMPSGTTGTDVVGGRDPAIIYRNGRWIMGVTVFNVGVYDTTFYTSTDLKSWDRYRVKFGSGISSNTVPAPGATHPCNQVWGPQLFVYDNVLYCGLTLPYGNDFVDINGTTIPDFRQYIARCTDESNFTFDLPVLINQSGNTQCQIDGSFYFMDDNLWHLFSKNDYNKNIEHWTSSTMTGTYTKVGNVIDATATGFQTEAFKVVKREGFLPKYIGYADRYDYNTYLYTESSDLSSWTTPVPVQCDRSLRHGDIINASLLPVKAQKDVITNCALRAKRDNREVQITASNASFSPRDGYIYYVTGTSSFSLNFAEAGAKEFRIAMRSSSELCTLTIGTGTYFAGIAASAPLILNGAKDNGVIVTFTKINTSYHVDFQSSADTKSIAFSGVTGFPNISSFAPVVGAMYTTDGSSTYSAVTNINSISTAYPDGAYFYINRQNETATNGNILLKYDANSIAVASAGISLTATDLRVYTVRKIAGKWRFFA